MDDSVTIQLDEDTSRKLRAMTKAQLVEKLTNAALEAETFRLRCQSAVETERSALREVEIIRKRLEETETKLAKAESYVEQGRAMLNAVMNRWYEYDV